MHNETDVKNKNQQFFLNNVQIRFLRKKTSNYLEGNILIMKRKLIKYPFGLLKLRALL